MDRGWYMVGSGVALGAASQLIIHSSLRAMAFDVLMFTSMWLVVVGVNK